MPGRKRYQSNAIFFSEDRRNADVGTIQIAESRQAPVQQLFWRLGAIALLITLLSSCGDSTPEARLEAAGDALDDTSSELVDLSARIDRTETELEKLRDRRRKLRNEVRTLEQRLEARATDVALFRAVQMALLEDKDLQEAAVVDLL